MCRCKHKLRMTAAPGSAGGSRTVRNSRLSKTPGKAGGCVIVAVVVIFIAGCQQEMANQPRHDPLEPHPVFTEELMSRTPVRGTIARGGLRLDVPFFTGKENGEFVRELPEAALAGRTMPELLSRGKERYTIFCSHCHGQVGGGIGGDPLYEKLVGMVVQRGYPVPPTYHQDRLRQAPIGHFFDVITNGVGRMPPHGYLVLPDDRWAIAAYIRALQLSQFAPRDQLAPQDLEKLTAQPPAPALPQNANPATP